ncbi:MAG: radical SAM family heme chaperone HemW [Acholeplasmatales bacterium]|jgi:oxygen-independent coproporphyrinogen-3 oxidase|nr:radical SAM family heme chaperone HemW [Acholeplasmatales bacterium]
MKVKRSKGLYIHIPFCKYICSYCDFCKFDEKRVYNIDKYIDVLVSEISNYRQYFSEIDTIYIGGGTPNYLSLNNLKKLFDSLKDIKPLEYTIEINSDIYNKEQGELFVYAGINRVSIGAQTFEPSLINILKREHNYNITKECVDDLRNKGINNINIDMIYAIPTQTIKQLKNDLKNVSSLNPTHISYYSLILEEDTFLYYQYVNKKINLIDEDTDYIMNKEVNEYLENNGYMQYEISNYARNCNYSIHNLKYWNMEDYIGVGLSACGYYNNTRYSNTKILNSYLKGKYETEEEVLDASRTLCDTLMLGLRKICGVNIKKIEQEYRVNLLEVFPEILKKIDEGLLEVFEGNLRLTKDKGIYLANQVFMIFV